MATLKKNAINQVMFTMVDKTDFATIETSLASEFTVKKFGIAAIGTVASATITTVASAVKKVGSGVYKIPLTASQCNYDQLMIRVAHASAATQMLWYELKTMNDQDASNLLSYMSNIVSGLSSRVPSLMATNSGMNSKFVTASISAASAVWAHTKGASALSLLSQLRVRADYSNVSDLTSKIAVANWGVKWDTNSTASSFGSAFEVLASRVSALRVNIPSTIATNSGMDSKFVKASISAASAVWAHAKATSTLAYGAVAASMASDTNSWVRSTLQSRISGISDILSKVYVQTTSMLSIVSDVNSNFISFVGNWQSYASDVASQVWAHANGASVVARVSQIKAYAIGASNIISQIYTTGVNSYLSGISDILSKVYVQTTSIASQTSDTQSNLISFIGNFASYASDIASRAAKMTWETDYSLVTGGASTYGSRLLILPNTSYVSDIRSYLSDQLSKAQSSIESHVSDIGAGAVSASDISDIASLVWAYNLVSQTGAGTAASNLANAQSLTKMYLDMSISDVYSLVSDVQSAVAAAATASDVASKVWASPLSNYVVASTFGSRFNVLATSDALSKAQSKICSHVSGITATVSDSVMSDIASRVWSAKYTAHSVASSFGSLFSDVYSRIVKIQSTSSNANSALISLMGSRMSGISDILSKVYVAQTSQYVRINGSLLSGISDILSKVYVQTTSIASQTSNTNSLLISLAGSRMSYLSNVISGISDILSKVYVQTTSMTSDIISMISTVSQLRVRMNYSTASDLASLIATTNWGVKWDVHSTASTFGSAFEWILKRMSYLSDISSKTYSMLTGASWMSNLGSVFWNDVSGMSDLASRTASMVWIHTKGASALSLLSQLRVRAAYSTVSDLTSKIAVANWGVKWDVNSTASSFGSAFEVLASRVSALRVRAGYSTASDLQSGIVSAIWAASVSTFKTGAASFGSRFAKLTTSDALSKAQSDIDSHISGLTVNAVTASDISDIASAVWGASISTLKGVAASFGSRYAKLTTSDALSKAQSSINSHVSGVTATVDNASVASAVWARAWDTASAAGSFGSAFEVLASRTSAIRVRMGYSTASAFGSDIASAVWSAKWDVHSGASGFGSAFEVLASRVSATRAIATSLASTASTISKIYSQTTSIASDVISMLSTVSQLRVRTNWSTVSDLASKIVSHTWGVTLASNLISRVSDMYSYLSDFNTHGVDLTASAISDIRSAVEAVIDSEITDATVLTTGGLKERIRTMSWILRNKMNVIKASGNTQIYKDDNATKGLSTAAALTSDATSVLRKRMA